jgi:hypothetical protein
LAEIKDYIVLDLIRINLFYDNNKKEWKRKQKGTALMVEDAGCGVGYASLYRADDSSIFSTFVR